MDIRQLTYFVHVVKEGSYTAAAKNLHVSQPALSKMIKNLEEELGVQLFSRSEKRLELTDTGQELFRQSQKLLEEFQAISESIQNIVGLKKGHVKVGIPPVIGTCYFPSLIANFRREYPGIKLTIIEEGAKTVQDMVNDRQLDVGVVILPVHSDVFHVVPIVKDENVLVVHKDHKLASYTSVSYQDLRDETFVLLDEKFMLHHQVVAACREAGFEPIISIKSSQWDFLAELVSENQGISILPSPILSRYNSTMIKKIPINHQSAIWQIVLIVKKNEYVSFATQKFIDYVQKYVSMS